MLNRRLKKLLEQWMMEDVQIIIYRTTQNLRKVVLLRKAAVVVSFTVEKVVKICKTRQHDVLQSTPKPTQHLGPERDQNGGK